MAFPHQPLNNNEKSKPVWKLVAADSLHLINWRDLLCFSAGLVAYELDLAK